MGEMSLWIEHLDALARPLLQALLNSLWQGIMVAALVWFWLLVLRKVSATTRHAVWLVCLLTIGSLPVINLISVRHLPPRNPRAEPVSAAERSPQTRSAESAGPAVGLEENSIMFEEPPAPNDLPPVPEMVQTVAEPASPAVSDEPSRVAPILLLGPQAIPASAAGPPPIETAAFRRRVEDWEEALFSGHLPLILVCGWMVAGAGLWLRIVWSYLGLCQLRRQLGSVPAAQLELARQLARSFGIRRSVSLFTSSRVSMPMTIGTFRPLIILPPDLVHTLAAAELESVIAHELAHIKRWDYLTNLLQRLVQAGLFFHPAVWLIGRHLMIERELACDDWAVKTCEPHRYASCLTRLVELLSESRPLAAAAGILFGKHLISRRVEMILNRDRNATTVVSKSALAYAIGLAVIFIGVCSAISPAIAVPLAQGKAGQRPPTPPAKRPAPESPVIAPVAPLPPSPPAAPELAAPPEVPEPLEVPEAPPVPVAPVAPVAPQAPAASPAPAIPPAPAAPPIAVVEVQPPVPPAAPVAVAGQVRPVVAPNPRPAVWVVGPDSDQDDKDKDKDKNKDKSKNKDDKEKKTVLSESELLGVLTDVVKRDSDPTVRNEALQGIYRMRSDAAVNALINLYDGIGDVKVKKEIIAYLMRRNGDNGKAISKLTSIAKSESNEELRTQAIRYLAGFRSEEGANSLIQIYDSIQDSKTKQMVIRYLAYNRSRKAVEKLIHIAKNDSDPAARQVAIRSLNGVDGRFMFEWSGKGKPQISSLGDGFQFAMPPDSNFNFNVDPKLFKFDGKQFEFDGKKFEFDGKQFEFDGKKFEFDGKQWEEMQKQLQMNLQNQQEILRQVQEQLRIQGLDNLKIEIPKIELKLKELEKNLKFQIDREKTEGVQKQMFLRLIESRNQLAELSSQPAPNAARVAEMRDLRDSLERQLQLIKRLSNRPAAVTLVRRPAPAKAAQD